LAVFLSASFHDRASDLGRFVGGPGAWKDNQGELASFLAHQTADPAFKSMRL
jgi:hypothetical protein